MALDLLSAPPTSLDHSDSIKEPASPSIGPPSSPALSSEQIRNRSSKGWTAAAAAPAGTAPSKHSTSSPIEVPPLKFRTKHPMQQQQQQQQQYLGVTSAGISVSATTDSAPSVGSTLSNIDGGSPFGSIIHQFRSPQTENVRKSSGSFKVLEKKAVSNSPFLTGGNTSSSSPTTTTRKPFSALDSSSHAFRQSQSNWSAAAAGQTGSPNLAPSSPARHGLGLLPKSFAGINGSDISHGPFARQPRNYNSDSTLSASAAGMAPVRPSHRRNHSDAENQDPKAVINSAKHAAPQILSPATLFNAEMEAIGAPPAMDVTHSPSASSPSLSDINGQAILPKVRTGPRPSVANLSGRNVVSTSPFLQQQQPQLSPSYVPSSQYLSRSQQPGPQETDDSPASLPPLGPSPVKPSLSETASYSSSPEGGLSSPPKRTLGPRQPSVPDLSQPYDDEEERVQGTLPGPGLNRKASKKSVTWAEVEEVCEFDYETEDGESRRSSAASDNHSFIDEYGDRSLSDYGEDDNEEARRRQEILDAVRQVQELDLANQPQSDNDEDYYDNYRHSSMEPEEEEEEEATIHHSVPPPRPPLPLAPEQPDTALTTQPSSLSREASVLSQHGSLVDPESSLQSSDTEEENEVQKLLREVDEANHLCNRRLSIENDLFARSETEFRTPHSSLGSYSFPSNQSTPQSTGSLTRRPLPIVPMSVTLASSTTEPIQEAGSLYRNGDESEYSLPDLALSDSPFLSFDEFALARKESLKRGLVRPASIRLSGSPKVEVLDDGQGAAEAEAARSVSARPRLTAEDIRESLRKRPASAFASLSTPMTSTPPSGTSKLGSSSKAIPARPALAPVRISSEELPVVRTSTPSPVPASNKGEPESALDRLVREAQNGGNLSVNDLAIRRHSAGSDSTADSYATAHGSENEGKDALKQREEAIIAAKRKKLGVPRAGGRRRSLSTGDADINDELARSQNSPAASADPTTQPSHQQPLRASTQLDDFVKRDDLNFSQNLGRALDSVVDYHERGYRVREFQPKAISYLGPGDSKVSTVGKAGDVDAGKAWRKVRRASDIHEHRSQIREYKQNSANRARETGAVFIKVGKLLLNERVPIPGQKTFISCELNNGLQLVATQPTPLSKETSIAQEFELIAHPKLEITLTFKVRRDPKLDTHLVPKVTYVSTPSSPSRHSHTGSAGGGFRSGLKAFLSSPKKTRPASSQSQPKMTAVQQQPAAPILDHLSQSGELCSVVIRMEQLFDQCTGQRLKTLFPCTPASRANRVMKNIADIEIQLFHLPPLPRVSPNELPQSIEECLTGLEKAERYDRILYEGVLTQQGADCPTWRRRQMRLQGSRLIAFNEITHKPHAIIQISQAVALEDPDDQVDVEGTPSVKDGASTKSTTTTTTTTRPLRQIQHKRTLSLEDDDDPYSIRPHSFKVLFEDDSLISFFADTAPEKTRWIRMLKPLIKGGKNAKLSGAPPLWAQELRAINKERAKNAAAGTTPASVNKALPATK